VIRSFREGGGQEVAERGYARVQASDELAWEVQIVEGMLAIFAVRGKGKEQVLAMRSELALALCQALEEALGMARRK